MAETKKAATDRRSFLKMAGLGSVAGGAALVTGKDAKASVKTAEDGGSGYRETAHVAEFYKSARF